MSDPIKDPTKNFTIPSQQPAGMRIPEFAVMNLIGVAIQRVVAAIGTRDDIIPKLYAFLPEDVQEQIRGWLLEHQNIFIDVSFPRDDAHLAMIVVEPQGEQESTPDALLGDAAGISETGVLGSGIISSSRHHAVPEKRTTSIYIASNDDRLTLYLYELVKFIVFSNKWNLEEWYDLHNVSVSGQVLDPDSDKYPTFVYYRVLQMQYLTLFDWNGLTEVAMIVDLNLLVDTREDGHEALVEVPNP